MSSMQNKSIFNSKSKPTNLQIPILQLDPLVTTVVKPTPKSFKQILLRAKSSTINESVEFGEFSCNLTHVAEVYKSLYLCTSDGFKVYRQLVWLRAC